MSQEAAKGLLIGFTITFFVLAAGLFALNSPVVGGASIATGASMLAIAATQKKNTNG